jgi:oligopeptide/dipeptide ABC transporter ATP-binding protein
VSTQTPLLSVRDLVVGFPAGGGHELRAVAGVSFDLWSGESLVIVGESGSGKSLTALTILGLAPREARIRGRVEFDGRDLLRLSAQELRAIRGHDIAMIYQDPMSAFDPVWTIGDQIVETIRAHESISPKVARQRAVEVLARVHLPEPEHLVDAYPHELSGGMRQRALIAMALSCGPRLLIADEPTTALDVTIQAQILELLRELRHSLGLAILFITHDMGVAADLADRLLVMYAGRAVEVGAATRIFAGPSHPYTDALLHSADLAAAAPKQPLRAIPGAPPSLGARPPGCAFHPRCPRAQAPCRTQPPALERIDAGHLAACHFPLEAPVGLEVGVG